MGPRPGTLNRTGDGYLEVRSGEGSSVYVHRLVAYAHGLIDGMGDAREVHHRDGVVDRNAPENLQAVTHHAHAGYHLNRLALSD